MPMTLLPQSRAPVHPGEMLLSEFLEPHGLTQTELAHAIGVSYPRINELVHGKRGVTPDTALRLARFFGTTEMFWLNLQMIWDLYRARLEASERGIDAIEPLTSARG